MRLRITPISAVVWIAIMAAGLAEHYGMAATIIGGAILALILFQDRDVAETYERPDEAAQKREDRNFRARERRAEKAAGIRIAKMAADAKRRQFERDRIDHIMGRRPDAPVWDSDETS